MSSEVPVLLDITLGHEQLVGAILGERVYQKVIAPAARVGTGVLLLSARGANHATSSFFKATWLALRANTTAMPPVMLAHASDELREEFDTFLGRYRLPGMEALDWNDKGVVLARLHGHIEAPSLSALRALVARPGSTAPELHKDCGEDVTTTAWTNRLNELYRHGLATRAKAGRAWKFYAVSREFLYG
jgi:hypothetical protein